MRNKEIRILSTRPLDDALIEKAAFENIKIEEIPFIKIKKLVSDEVAHRIIALSDQKATVVFTSMNAVEIIVEVAPENPLMPDWKIYCIGGATFTLVKKYWPYNSIVFTAKDASELATRIVNDKVENVVFFCGNKRREELPGLLRQQNIAIEELVVYETIETPAHVDTSFDAILFFSPSAVHSYFSENQVSEETVFFAIGNTTAATLKQYAKNPVIISDFPAKDQLVDKAIKYYSEAAFISDDKD